MTVTRKEAKPVMLTAAKQTSTTGVNQDGNAVYGNGTRPLPIIADALVRICDELHHLNQILSLSRHDDTEVVGLARIIAENGASHARR